MSQSNKTSIEEFAHSDQELVGSVRKRKQYLKLGALFLVACLVVGGIVLAVYLVTGEDNFKEDSRKPLELENILRGTLSARRFNGTWIDDNSFHYFDNLGNLKIYKVKEQTSEILISREPDSTNASDLLTASSYTFSFDKRYLLVATEIIKLFRHSYLGYYDVYDTESKTITQITIGGSRQYLTLVKFSPADNSMIVLHDGNIYWKSSPFAAEIKITSDGSMQNRILYGTPDWVYEEEVFSSNNAVWFSPNGQRIAYIKFDDSKVPSMNIPIYGEPGNPLFQYPQTLPVSYPKAAAKNPEVSLFYINVADITNEVAAIAASKEIAVPSRFVNEHKDHLITSVSWATNNDLIAVFMNRVQNKGDILKCSISGGTTTDETIFPLDVDGGWVEFYTAPFYNRDGSEIIFINSVNKYRHVVSVKINAGTRNATPRTSGNFVVTEILVVNKEHNLIVFLANTEDDVKASHVYVVKNEDGADKVCLTCGAMFSPYTYFSAEVSTDGNSFAIIAEGPEVPKVYLMNLDVTKLELIKVLDLDTNNDLKRDLDERKIPRVIYDTITLDNGSKSQVKMVIPSDLDPMIKHPMIIDVYGGPDSSSVTNRWSIDWGTYLVSARNYIYVRIDGRGSGLKGDENLFKLYRRLGTVEVHDQIETAQKLQKKYDYIDEKRSAIWGWSYGGYVSGMSLANDHDEIFKCAVSVAPVTDWTLYDSIYTERYMGLPTPTDNSVGYANSTLMRFIGNIKAYNKSYMLVHGTRDDNVHFQQGMMLARALERNDIMFREITYPDEDHSLAGVRPHLYHSLEKFFSECFQ